MSGQRSRRSSAPFSNCPSGGKASRNFSRMSANSLRSVELFPASFVPSFSGSFMNALPIAVIFSAATVPRGTCAFSPRLPKCPELPRFPDTFRLRPVLVVRPRATAAAIPRTLCEAPRAFAPAPRNPALARRQFRRVAQRTDAAVADDPAPRSWQCAAATPRSWRLDGIPRALCACAKKSPRSDPPPRPDRVRCAQSTGTHRAGAAGKAIQRRPDRPPRIAAALPSPATLYLYLPWNQRKRYIYFARTSNGLVQIRTEKRSRNYSEFIREITRT